MWLTPEGLILVEFPPSVVSLTNVSKCLEIHSWLAYWEEQLWVKLCKMSWVGLLEGISLKFTFSVWQYWSTKPREIYWGVRWDLSHWWVPTYKWLYLTPQEQATVRQGTPLCFLQKHDSSPSSYVKSWSIPMSLPGMPQPQTMSTSQLLFFINFLDLDILWQQKKVLSLRTRKISGLIGLDLFL